MSSMGHVPRNKDSEVNWGWESPHIIFKLEIHQHYNIEIEETLILKKNKVCWTSLNISKIQLGGQNTY